MDTIKIPSPSAILDLPPSPSLSRRVTTSREIATSPEAANHVSGVITTNGMHRPKQSKSRNGCITCKAKRLKCDETKPSCEQCHKRNVTCGGYKKDFKWRSFEETQAISKVTSRKKVSPSPDPTGRDYQPRKAARKGSTSSEKQSGSRRQSKSFSAISSSLPDEFILPETPTFHDTTSPIATSFDFDFGATAMNELISPNFLTTPDTEISDLIFSSTELYSLSQPIPTEFDEGAMHAPCTYDTFPSIRGGEATDDQDVEDIINRPESSFQIWPVGDMSLSSRQEAVLPELCMPTMLFQELEPAPGSEEALIVRFDRLTCGILSVKDGMTENPWRNLIWPMARESSALYHAVISMAAFHASKDNPALRVLGMEHMRRSISLMVQGMGQMQTDAALATTLSLAFAETWDQQTSTGIQHLKGARALMRQTLRNRVRACSPSNDLGRIRFLYNTWLYMDVIARITSMEDADTDDVGEPPLALVEDGVHDVDPLMGCAATLFPLIGDVASLVQRIRKTNTNSFSIISQAREQKNAIDRWVLPDSFNPPEDPQSELQDSIQTAYAYRWAILLYLHQAVPEIPSPPSSVLASNTLKLLATIPLSSRTNILHIFPLFVASCEFEEKEDRAWIMQRWTAMQQRLRIANIDRCIEVIREVWRRRDEAKKDLLTQQTRPVSRRESLVAYTDNLSNDSHDIHHTMGAAQPTHKRHGSVGQIVEELDFEQTVRGSHHWVGVMRDWKWEVLLG